MDKNVLRVGIVGCGKIAQTRHIPEYAANEHVTIVGYYDFIAERAEEMSKRYGGRAFASVEELLASDEIDAVSVCSANATHASITVAALRAGKHVLCEKPMATTPAECEEMLAEATAAKRRLMIAHNQRFCPVHAEARALIAEGAIGTPLAVRTCFGHSGPDNWSVDPGTSNWFFNRKMSAFGAMADLGVHKIDLVRFLLGCEICDVSAMLATLDKRDAEGNPVGVEDNAAAIYRAENGAIITMNASWTFYGEEDNSTTVYGSEGILKLSPADECITLCRKNGEKEIRKVPSGSSSGVIDAFVDAILTGTPSVIDVEEVLPSMRVLFATAESAHTGNRMIL